MTENKNIELKTDKGKENGIMFYVYSKQVNSSEINKNKKTREIDRDNISKIIDSLLNLGTTRGFAELELRENPKKWVHSILDNYPDITERDVNELLNDFTDSMNTRMKEEEKYALCIVMSDSLILCHSRFGEKTITPEWEIMKRMLDKDNVLRYVYFKRKGEDIKITFFEENHSVFFADWLGIPEKEALAYVGGKNRIYTEVYGLSFVFEITDDDFEEKFIKNKTFEVKDDLLILPDAIETLPLRQLRRGRKPYKNMGDFIQDFLANRYGLTFYQNKYHEIHNPGQLSLSNFDSLTKKIIDDEFEVRYSDEKNIVKKINPEFSIIFADKKIEIRPSFLSKLKSKILNNESFRIFHAGGEISPDPIKIKNLEIYNKLNQTVSKKLLDYFSQLSIRDDFEKILLFIIFEIMSQENKGSNMSFFLHQLSDSMITGISFSNKFVNGEDKVLELKSRDFVSGNNKQILENLSEDIKKKVVDSRFKIYVLGADEKTKEYKPLPLAPFDDNRIEDIKTKLQESIHIQPIWFLKVPSHNGKECILLLVLVLKNNK